MADATCSVEGCDRPPAVRGWCSTHYSRWLRTGDPSAAVPVVAHRPPHAPDSQCAVDGCERSPKGGTKGWCHAHFERWRITGDVRADVPLGVRQRRLDPVCAVDGCAKPRKARIWCAMHYARWQKHGDPLVGGFSPAPAECSADGCAKKPKNRGLCGFHWGRLERYGDPLADRPERPRLPNSEVNYFNMHTRLRKARGSASAHQCVRCDRPAAQWAYIHGEDPSSFDSYTPMCRSCHKKYDMTPETRERNRRAQFARAAAKRARPQESESA